MGPITDIDWSREFPIRFRWRRPNGVVLIEVLVSSRFACVSLPHDTLQELPSGLTVEYRLPNLDEWIPAVMTDFDIWAVQGR